MSPRRTPSGRPTINDVAVQAGVSVATVSRALRGLDNVTEQTRNRVEQAARDLEYHIDRRASRLATGRHETVGLVVPRIDTWYFSTVLAGIESVLGHDDDLLLVCVDDAAARTQLVAGSAPLGKRVDGLIFVDVLLAPDEAASLQRAGLRVATIGQQVEGFPSVTIDNFGAARLATEHLSGLGHEHIALISGVVDTSLPYSVPTDRRRGYLATMAEQGHQADECSIVDTAIGIEEGARAMAQLLDTDIPPTAVFAVADELAFGAIAELRRRGIDVPGDVSVVGFDDHPLAAAMDLTTITQDPYHQGLVGAELFESPVGDGLPATQLEAPTALVIRGSSGVAAVPEPR